MFEITIQLCKEFQGLDPIKLRTYRSGEVFKFLKRLFNYHKKDRKNYTKNGERIEWRPATNWY